MPTPLSDSQHRLQLIQGDPHESLTLDRDHIHYHWTVSIILHAIES
jgi:hypothetical protein